MKKIIFVLMVIGMMGCASQKWEQKESDQMLQKKANCKWATILQARLTCPDAQDAHWNDILAFPEYRDYYQNCLKRP